MKHWKILAACISLFAVAFALAKPTVDGRLSWYNIGSDLDGAHLLLTCLSKSPVFMYGDAYPLDKPLRQPILANVEVWYACQTAENRAESLVSAKSRLGDNNPTISSLITFYSQCYYPRYTDEQTSNCSQSHFDAIDWMLDKGAPINPPMSCGYLHQAALEMNEDMFHFLLLRGANASQLCPHEGLSFGPGTEQYLDTKPQTVAEKLASLLDGYSEQEKQSLVGGWTRMLDTLESRE